MWKNPKAMGLVADKMLERGKVMEILVVLSIAAGVLKVWFSIKKARNVLGRF